VIEKKTDKTFVPEKGIVREPFAVLSGRNFQMEILVFSACNNGL